MDEAIDRDDWSKGYILAKHNIKPDSQVSDVAEFVEGFTLGAISVCEYERLSDYVCECIPVGSLRRAVLEAIK